MVVTHPYTVTRHYSTCFICINSLNPYSNAILQMRKLKHKDFAQVIFPKLVHGRSETWTQWVWLLCPRPYHKVVKCSKNIWKKKIRRFSPCGILTFWKYFFPNTLAIICYIPLCCRMTLLIETPRRLNWQIKKKFLNVTSYIFFFSQMWLPGNHRKWPELFINKGDGFHQTIQTSEDSGSRGYLKVEGVTLGWEPWVPVPHDAFVDVLLGERAGGSCCPPIRKVLPFVCGAVCRHIKHKDHLP